MQIPTLSHSQVRDLIKSVGHKRTVIVLGENGVGKTSIQYELRQDSAFLGHNVLDPIDCTQLSDGSVWMPDIDREAGVSRELPNERFCLSKSNHRGLAGSRPSIICLDELFKAPQFIKNVLAPVIFERRTGTLHYPEGSIIWGTSNLAVEGLGDSVLAHLRTRMLKVIMRKPTKDEWKNEFAYPFGLHHAVIVFVDQNPIVFESFMDYEPGGINAGKDMSKCNVYPFNPRIKQDGHVSPRTLHAASDVLHTCGHLDHDTLLAALAGAIGEAGARTLMALVALDRDIPLYDRIVADPVNTPIIDNPAAQLMQIQQFIVNTKSREDAQAVTVYIKRMRAEMQSLFVNQISNSPRLNTFATVDAFRSMMSDNKLFLNLK